MLRWAIRSVAANSYKNKVISEFARANSKSRDAMREFSRAKREKDINKKMDYISDGMSDLAEAVSHNSNAVEPLAEMSFVASLLVESIQDNLDEQTKDIIEKIKAWNNITKVILVLFYYPNFFKRNRCVVYTGK